MNASEARGSSLAVLLPLQALNGNTFALYANIYEPELRRIPGKEYWSLY